MQPLFTAATDEQFCADYNVHELPNESGDGLSDVQSTSALPSDISSLIESASSLEIGSSNAEVLVNTALLARIEVLEAENCTLKSKKEKPGLSNSSMMMICFGSIQGLYLMILFWLFMSFWVLLSTS